MKVSKLGKSTHTSTFLKGLCHDCFTRTSCKIKDSPKTQTKPSGRKSLNNTIETTSQTEIEEGINDHL